MDSLKLIYEKSSGIRRYFILAFSFVWIETIFEVMIPYLMSGIIDVGIVQKDTSIFYSSGILMLASALLSLFFGILYARCAAKAATLLGKTIRQEEFDKIQNFSFSNIDHFENSGLITRLSSDVNVVQNAITTGIRPVARGPIMLIMGLVMSFLINWQLALVFLVITPILAFGLVYIVKKVVPQYPLIQKTMDIFNGIIQENLIAIRVVKAFVRKDFEVKKFEKINDQLRNLTRSTFHFALLNQPLFQATMYGATIAIIYLGSAMILKGSMQVGELTGILSYVMQIMNSFMMMSNVFLLLSRSIASINRIVEIFKEESTIVSLENGKTIEDGSIEFDHVSFKYSADAMKNVLEDINFKIPAGSSLGIIGATGSAKTSLVSLIPRLYDVSSGSVKISGIDVRDLDLYQLREDVGMVLQNNVLFSGTIEENLRWGNEDATRSQINHVLQISCCDEFINRLPGGLDMELGQGGVNVSGGQKQRLCIARALLKNPKILIFDDSTSAVDTATDKKIKEGLASISSMTQIIISQRVSSIAHCDRILVLQDGKVNQIADHETLVNTNPIYQEIFNSQQRGNQNA